MGGKLVSPEGTIQHGGVILGLGEWDASAFQGIPEDAIIYNQPHRLIRNCSAVRSTCMLTTREIFDKLGGFDEQFPGRYADIDFCLRMRKLGHWIVWTPFAALRYYGPGPNGAGGPHPEEGLFRSRWKDVLSKPDPFYNVNLTRKYFDFSPDVD